MKVVVRNVAPDACPSRLAPFIKSEQLFITVEREYEIHAIVVFQGISFVQLVDDIGYPRWLPTWLFETCDRALPEDWIVNIFHDDGADVIIGPPYVADQEASYVAMVELDAEMVEKFWKRIAAMEEREVERRGGTGGSV